MIQLTLKETVSKSLNRRLVKLRNQSYLQKIARDQQEEVQRRIKSTKVGPDGIPWAPWSSATLKARRRKGTLNGGLLYETGALWRSIRASVINTTIRISAGVKYAQYLQKGTLRMPARPFLGWSNEAIRKIKALIAREIK